MSFVHHISPRDFHRMVYEETAEFERKIAGEHAFVVEGYFPAAKLAEFRGFLETVRNTSAPTWHPCKDGCPDYQRINDEYPHSYVRGRFRTYNFFPWNQNRRRLEDFGEIYALKNYLAGKPADSYLANIPSNQVVAILGVKHYPRGGGYLEEHIDPVSEFARVQTIIQASEYGKDFQSGGVYYRRRGSQEPIFLDPISHAGDLIVLSPRARHGVMPIDPAASLDWNRRDGRMMIIPIFQFSDYVEGENVKAKRVARE